jgi:hypothetical protein
MRDLGLNIYLLPNDSPISNNQTITSSYDFDSQNERNSVSNSKIAYMSADKIASGTVIVGLNLGSSTSGYVLLDGANNRIVVNDGTTNRIVIGDV